ncbi:FAD-dependent oxidoreductase [Tenacibaculum sp. M341]|uniref:FAD-dependent oxidoreductase n=1 Tax=Tenacibaculum sp. M341 TaxID=2530339 RepID=UPI0010497063|nr:FAD-dependent oxidoreductase [Tenacibaculum sp. M341]TCI94388.1 FAD-dependent oxidoreductase [Tenacibaculum sp. M341]
METTKQNTSIHIIGAGISGLITAIVLEKHGFSPVIIEASNNVGGRVKTDIIDGYQLDRGFQVLLTAYPAAKKYLDYNSLDLQKLTPGAVVFNKKGKSTIGDPTRKLNLLLPTIFSSVGSIADKLKIFTLNNSLKQKPIDAIFNEKTQSTLSFLREKGFSNNIIASFFKPFFSGIFLEDKLATPSIMFEFIYKMFGNGYAAIPKDGMQAIPDQLRGKLKNTQFIFNSKVTSITDNTITLADSTNLKSDIIVVATEASKLLNLNTPKTQWKSCDTLYFKVKKKTIQQPIIVLIADETSLINNIFFHTSIKTNTDSNEELLSVTIVKQHELSEEALIKKVTIELKELCGIEDISFLKRYEISKALPKLSEVSYDMPNDKIKVSDHIFLSGDTLVNGSLNAAMISGEQTALKIVDMLNNSN